MRPQLEHLPRDSRTSWALLFRELAEIPFLWHYHPEYELTLTLNARGQRYVGDALEDFGPGDLVLVGPNVAHTWSARQRPDAGRPMRAIVVWFTGDWARRLVDVLPELAPALTTMLARAAGALSFSPAAAAQVSAAMCALQAMDEFERVPAILDVLVRLARDDDARPLTLSPPAPGDDETRRRLARVLDVLHERWIDPPTLPELAAVAALSVGAFHRFFKRHAGCSVLAYVARLRIGQACQRLIETDRPVNLVAAEVGYASLAQFNRQFLRLTGRTPRALRRSYREARRPDAVSPAALPVVAGARVERRA